MRIGPAIGLLLLMTIFAAIIDVTASNVIVENISAINESINRSSLQNNKTTLPIELEPIVEINHSSTKKIALGPFPCELFHECPDSPGDGADKFFNQGNKNYQVGNYKIAIDNYNQAVEINPQLAEAWYNKGNALYKLGKCEDAIKAYDNAIIINPKFREAKKNKEIVAGTNC